MLHDSNWLIIVLLLGMGGLTFLGLVGDAKHDQTASSAEGLFASGDDK